MALLEGKRITLRALEPEDLDLLYCWENDTNLWYVGNTLSPYSKYVLKQYIEDSDNDIYKNNQLRLMIELKENGETIGTVDLFDFDPFHNRAGIGILIDSDHQRKGYAGEALKLVEEYCFMFLKMHQLFAYIPQENIASVELFSGLGFQQSGTLADWRSSSEGYTTVLLYQLINKKH